MQSRRTRAAIALAALAAAVALFVILRDDETEPTTTPPPAAEERSPEAGPAEEPPEREPEPAEPEIPTIVLRDGEPVGGAAELTFRRGERIRLVVRSDVAEELHLHGYDVYRDVEAGGRARFDLEAELEGVYELETHHGGATVAEIAVRP